MIISRSPFRITLAGGGTDLPAFYKKYGGAVTSMALDKYIYICFKKKLLDSQVRVQYLKTEIVENANKLSHERARAALQHFGVLEGCEIASVADLPAKSGLGSSGSYLVGLINCLQVYKKRNLNKHEIADIACHIEMEKLQEPVGKQDQFIASYGGIRTFNISTSGKVEVSELNLDQNTVHSFVNRCRIYYTGLQRGASKILKSQTKNRKNFDDKMLKIRDLGFQFVEALENQNFDKYGMLLDDHWRYKRQLSAQMSHSKVDSVYNYLKNESLILGGKIIGAGGGGFLMVYVPCETKFKKVDHIMEENQMNKLDYALDQEGATTIYEQ